jgi:hypothetical protein
MTSCAYDNCPRRVDYVIDGVRWCGMHGRRIKKNGSPDAVRRVQNYAGSECSVAECPERPRRNGMCAKHSRQVRTRNEHPLHATWRSMMDRCECPTNAAYANYGGRGITVCPRWRNAQAFIEDIGQLLGRRPEGMSLDRIHNGLGYKPSNVRWATRTEQNRNRQYRRSSYPGLARRQGVMS